MSWVTIIWSMVASACLTLTAVNLLVWCKKRTEWANLVFSSTAVAAATMAFCELCMMRAETPGQFGTALRWLHMAAYVIIVSLIGFVLFYMRAGRPWLAWTTGTIRTISLLLNYLTGENLNYREVTGLRHITLLGESVSSGEGVSNPWMLLGQLSLVLFVVFVADATISVWRRGDRRLALVTGGSIVFFVLAGTVQSVLVLWQIVHWPYAPSLCFMGIVAAMAYEMSRETLRAAQLSDDLRESEERMTLAAEAAGVGIWVWSIARNQIWGSEKWLRLFGFAPNAAVTFENLIQRIHPDDRESVERGMRQALEDRKEYAADFRLVLPDGSQQWVVARGRVHPDASGKAARMLGVAINITNRKRTELALAESELRYRALFDSAPEGIALIGGDGSIRAANLAQARLYGYESPRELEGLYAPLCVAEKDRERFLETMQALLEGQASPVRQYTAVRRDGTEFLVEVTSASLRGADKQTQGYLCLTHDITERERVEAALRQSMERFRSVAETVGEFIWEVDAAGLYTFASPAVERTLGYTPEELVGKKHFYDLFEPSVREERKAAAFQVFAARQKFRDFPNPNLSKSGKIVHLETSGAPMLDAAENLVGYRGADTDVTARKQSEQENAQQRNHLAHVARVSNLGQLASSLAHELNQPLGAILRNAEAAELFLAEASPDLDEVRAILADIRKGDHRAGTVIDRMRALMKRREVQRHHLDLGLVAGEVVALVRPDAELHRVRLGLEPSPALPPVQGDQAQLQQVVLNLLLNAMDAMSDNSSQSRLVTVRVRPTGKTVEVTVSDNGHGIAADKLPRLFEPFFTSKPNGLGMGLAISRDIIQAHGGRLWAENNAAGGARFTFALPVAEGEEVVIGDH